MHYLSQGLTENWPIWVVSITLIVAAVIDGMKLKVPNWITFPMIITGWIYSAAFSPYAGWEGLMFSLVGTAVGLALLLPAYAIGGMGAGDVKLLAAIGAFLGWKAALFTVFLSSLLGGIVGLLLIVTGKTDWQSRIPFGPYIVCGALTWLFFGQAILDWYMSLLQS